MIDHLKILYYISQQPFIQTSFDVGCHFCAVLKNVIII